MHAWRRSFILTAVVTCGITMLGGAPVFAAGGGYGPSAAVPGGVPGGFTRVVTAHTFSAHGGQLRGRLDGAIVTLDAAPGSLVAGTQIAITAANLGGVNHGLRGGLSGDHVLFAGGFVLDHRGHGAHSRRNLTVTIVNPNFAVGDPIVAFRGGRFIVIGHVTVAGHATLHVNSVSEIAVLS